MEGGHRNILFRIIDIAGSNANILINTGNPESKITHQKFLIALRQVLTRDQFVRRAEMKNIPRQLKELIRRVVNIPGGRPVKEHGQGAIFVRVVTTNIPLFV